MEGFDNFIKNKNALILIGSILHSSRAFLAPEVLHIDLTNHCNFNCIACWCRSPLLGEKTMPDWEKKIALPLNIIKGIFDDIDEMGGLRQVKLVGGGEPFMHPDIIKVVEYIKNKDKNIEVDINTNFSLVCRDIGEKLIGLGVDSLTVSLWAGSPEVYSSVHPNQTDKTFFKIKDTLKFISEYKRKADKCQPRIIIHNVICKLNYKDVFQMLRFALDIGADDIQFVPVDTVKDKTETLVLNELEKKELCDTLYGIKKHYDSKSFRYTSEDGASLVLSDFDGFIRRIERLNIKSGAYDEDIIEEVPCYAGWLFARVMARGDVVPCCKGHRMVMGNIHNNKFKEIWFSEIYNEFRYNGINLSKSNSYFSKIGNDAVSKTGCYNCDNLWQNIPLHKKVSSFKSEYPKLAVFGSALLRNVLRNGK